MFVYQKGTVVIFFARALADESAKSEHTFRDFFLFSELQVHHEKELEHLKRMMDRKEDDLLKNQTLERKALPKRIRQEMKAREQMFRASMRISVTNLNEVMNPTEEKDRLKKVSEEGKDCTKGCRFLLDPTSNSFSQQSYFSRPHLPKIWLGLSRLIGSAIY